MIQWQRHDKRPWNSSKNTRSGWTCGNFHGLMLIVEGQLTAPKRSLCCYQTKNTLTTLPIRPTGSQVYPQVFQIKKLPDKIIENIGWWLQSTEQGMWKARLQQTEEITRLPWMAISADEFNKEALKAQIWETTRFQVVLRYRAIDDGIIKWDTNNKTRMKALHIEVDKATSHLIGMTLLLSSNGLPFGNQDGTCVRAVSANQCRC